MGGTRSVGLGSAHVLNFETGSMALMGRQADVKETWKMLAPSSPGLLQDGPAHPRVQHNLGML
jgi:hypothetical protein